MKLDSAFKNFRSRKARPRIRDFVRGVLVKETPEEAIRQRVLRCLHFEYGFPHESLRCEDPLAPGTEVRERADIVIRLARSAPGEAVNDDGTYQGLVAMLRSTEDASALTALELPANVEIDLDGVKHVLALRGFVITQSGIAVHLDAQASPALPYVVEAYPFADAPTALDEAVRQVIGLPRTATSLATRQRFLRRYASAPPVLSQLLAGATSERVYLAIPVLDGRCVLASVGRSVWQSEVDKATALAAQELAEPAMEDVPDMDPDADWPIAVVECKAWNIPLGPDAEDQGVGYAMRLGAQYLVLTNGREARVLEWSDAADRWSAINELPTYANMLANTDGVAPARTNRSGLES